MKGVKGVGVELQVPDEAIDKADIWSGQIPRGSLSAAIYEAAPLIVALELERIGKVYADSSDRALEAGDNVLAAHQLGVSIYLEGRASELRELDD